jgi:hypothetical protein
MAESKLLKARWSADKASLVEVYYEGGGKLPEILSGAYTSKKDATKAIDLYLANSKKSTGMSGGK